MSALVYTVCDGEGFGGRGRYVTACDRCQDGYVLCVRCEDDRADDEFHLEGEGHICEGCYTSYLNARSLATLSDDELAFLDCTPAEIKALRAALAHGFSDADAVEMVFATTATAAAVPPSTPTIEPLPATPAHVLDTFGYSRESIADHRLAVLLGADPVDALELLTPTREEALRAA